MLFDVEIFKFADLGADIGNSGVLYIGRHICDNTAAVPVITGQNDTLTTAGEILRQINIIKDLFNGRTLAAEAGLIQGRSGPDSAFAMDFFNGGLTHLIGAGMPVEGAELGNLQDGLEHVIIFSTGMIVKAAEMLRDFRKIRKIKLFKKLRGNHDDIVIAD